MAERERTRKPIDILNKIVELSGPNNPNAIRWRKNGGGIFNCKNHIIKPGQEFMAVIDDIPKAFRDLIVPVDGVPVTEQVEEVPQQILYMLRQRGQSEEWDIVNTFEKQINESPLTKIEAENLLKALQR